MAGEVGKQRFSSTGFLRRPAAPLAALLATQSVRPHDGETLFVRLREHTDGVASGGDGGNIAADLEFQCDGPQ